MKQQVLFVDHWKGKDSLSVEQEINGFVLVSHRKDKESGDVTEIRTRVPFSAVKQLMQCLRRNFEEGKKYTYVDVVRALNQWYSLTELMRCDIDTLLNSFNGGRNRAKYYFPLYYNPLKVLELRGEVTFLGRGGIILRPKKEVYLW